VHFTIRQRQISALHVHESTKSVGTQFRWPEQHDETPRAGRTAAVMRELRVLAANYSAADSHRHAFINRSCPQERSGDPDGRSLVGSLEDQSAAASSFLALPPRWKRCWFTRLRVASTVWGRPATVRNIRPKSCTSSHQVGASNPNR
jgi:hypothetical protein